MVKIQTTILSQVHINVGNVREKCKCGHWTCYKSCSKTVRQYVFFFVSTERGNVEKKRNPTSVYRALEFLY